MNYKVKLKPTLMPNFLPIEGMKDRSIPVSSLSKQEAEEYAKLMHDAFLKHWANKVKQLNKAG